MMFINRMPCYIGVKLPEYPLQEINIVEADGAELGKCEKILGKNVPGMVWLFVGDEARTIVANWENVK